MNVYDFDGTIYSGDSSLDFYKYAVMQQPKALRCIYHQIWACFQYACGFCSRQQAKESAFVFLRYLHDIPELVEKFWDIRISNIQPWYLLQKRPDDVIITASPDFLIRPACEMLGIYNVIATEVDMKTGQFISPNNRDVEKVRRFRAEFGDSHIDEFYSDSRSDAPLAAVANRSYFVRNGAVVPWNDF